MGMKTALALEEDKQKKVKEEIDAKKERAIEVFKSSKAMEDIKIAFTQEAFLEGFKVCMKRIAKRFPDMDIDFLIEEPDDKAEPSYAGIASPVIEPDAETSDPTTMILEPIPEPGVTEDAPTSPAAPPLEVENL